MSNTANDRSVFTLIRSARELFQSDAELARALHMQPPTLNAMRKGKRAISPETVARLCELLDLPSSDAREWLAQSVIDNPKNAKDRPRLIRLFFRLSVPGVVASAIGVAGTGVSHSANLSPVNNLYIVRSLLNATPGLRLRRRSAGLRPEPFLRKLRNVSALRAAAANP